MLVTILMDWNYQWMILKIRTYGYKKKKQTNKQTNSKSRLNKFTQNQINYSDKSQQTQGTQWTNQNSKKIM